jgi:hypothetical protein
MCRRLPRDTTTDELMEHFNTLYPLDKDDWKQRLPLKGDIKRNIHIRF